MTAGTLTGGTREDAAGAFANGLKEAISSVSFNVAFDVLIEEAASPDGGVSFWLSAGEELAD